jgi:hypothetical protein
MKYTPLGFRLMTGIVSLSCVMFAQQDPAPVSSQDPVAEAPKPATPATQATPAPSGTQAEGSTPATGTIPIDKRIFAVLPNYRTADGTAPYAPITPKRKLYIGFKDSFDYPIFLTSAIYSSIYQLENSHPQFGQGIEGYAKRYLASSTDLAVGNFLSESIYPVILKQDPRYFAVGPGYGGVMKRTFYALTRVLICKSDTGKPAFNFSEILGNSTAVALSNLYYTDTRDVKDNVQSIGIQVGTDAFSNVLKEFWPDIKRKFVKKKTTPAND